MKPDLFDFNDKHNLHDSIRQKVAQLMMIDCKRAVPLLIQHRDIVSPSHVVSQLMAANNKCNDYRNFLHLYLHSLFECDSSNPHAGRDFHDMQLELYADYDPRMLLPFLQSSQHYSMEKAHEICVKRGLFREQVFILERMGDVKGAVAVIINKLGDLEEAIEFVKNQDDDELWEEVFKQCMNKPEMIGVLLEHTVGNLDPLHILNRLPNGLEIPRLRERLEKIMTDYSTETLLRHGCNDILKADCVHLQVKCYKEARRGIYMSNEGDEPRRNKISESAKRSARRRTTQSKIRCGTRCCICFHPLSKEEDVYVFFCCHACHETCLMDSIASMKHADGAGDDDDARIRCILCATAAASASYIAS